MSDTQPEQIPIGTPVRYWPGFLEGEGRESVTRSSVWRLGSGEPVVSVQGYAGGIALTNIERLDSGEGARRCVKRTKR